MAKEKAVDKNIEEIRALLKEDKLVMGTDQTIKMLKQNQLAKVILSANCRDEEEILKYSKLNGTEVVQLKYPNTELGTICKKPFSVSVLGVKR